MNNDNNHHQWLWMKIVTVTIREKNGNSHMNTIFKLTILFSSAHRENYDFNSFNSFSLYNRHQMWLIQGFGYEFLFFFIFEKKYESRIICKAFTKKFLVYHHNMIIIRHQISISTVIIFLVNYEPKLLEKKKKSD